jgi:hypothetical protein
VLVSAHGNSLRALVKHLSGISDAEITGLEIPTGQPIVYELDDNLTALERYYLSEREHECTAPVAIVMGSQSDWPTMKCAADALDKLGVAYDARIVSAHRTPDRLVAFAKGAADEGFKVIIAGAGGAAHLPGMVASMTHLPVLGVPVQSKALSGRTACCRSCRCRRDPGRHAGDRRGRRDQRRAAGRRDPRHDRPGAGRTPQGLPRRANRRRGRAAELSGMMIPPGETIGILGGGQLGRMLAMAAAQLGYRCHVYAPEADSVAADVCAAFTPGRLGRCRAAMAEFAADCAVVTYEFENVPVVRWALGQGAATPMPARWKRAGPAEREGIRRGLGGRPRPGWRSIPARTWPRSRRIGTPGILKTRRDGYDGKGQWRIMPTDHDADGSTCRQPLVYEGFVRFRGRIQRDPVPRPGWRHGVLGQRRERPRRRHPGPLDRAGRPQFRRRCLPPAPGRKGGRGARTMSAC